MDIQIAFDTVFDISLAGADLDTDVARLTALLTAHIERQVREHPEQWVWMHRRWKHQPGEGETVWRADHDGPETGEVPASGSSLD